MAGRDWDPRKTYGISDAERLAVQEKGRARQLMRMEWQKKVTDPHRGVGGTIFDPAVQRYVAMHSNHWDRFKATPKTAAIGLSLGVIPIFFFWYVFDRDKRRREAKFRAGIVSYRDREYKFL